MKGFAPNTTSDTPGRYLLSTWHRWLGLLLLSAGLLVAVSAGCSDTGYEGDELRLPDPEVLFLRQEPVPAGRVEVLNAEGIGELVLDGPCLRLRGDATIVWPAGSALHVDDGVVEVRDRAGQVLAKFGDEIAGGGGYAKSEYEECPGLVFRIQEITVLPDVDVYFLKHDGALGAGLNAKQFTGKLTLDGKCLEVDDAIREEDGSVVRGSPLLFWPQDYELNVQDGAVEVIDADGRVAARVGMRSSSAPSMSATVRPSSMEGWM